MIIKYRTIHVYYIYSEKENRQKQDDFILRIRSVAKYTLFIMGMGGEVGGGERLVLYK